MDVVEALERTYEHGARVVAAIRPTQLGDPTPCAAYDVRTVLNHEIGTMLGFADAVETGAIDRTRSDDHVGDDPAAAFRAAAARNLSVWRAPGALERQVELGFATLPGHLAAHVNLTDVLAHTWDLAKATGQDTTLDADVAAMALEFSQEFIQPGFRGDEPRPFGPEVEAPAGAPVGDRLVAFLGRRP